MNQDTMLTNLRYGEIMPGGVILAVMGGGAMRLRKFVAIGMFCLLTAGMVRAESVIEEIVVTAQKRSESVQEVPVSVSVVSSVTLEQRGVRDVDDLMFVVPSLQAGRQNGRSAITIRGVGLNDGTPGVALHTDGVYQPREEMADLAQLDLERIEVLRGPQGTVYGRNANGGVINFVTAMPAEEFGGHVRVGFASYNEKRALGVLNVPVSDKILTRLTVDWVDRNDGYIRNVLPGGQDLHDEESLNYRLRVVGDPTDTFSYDLSISGARRSGALTWHTTLHGPVASSLALFPLLATGIYATEPLTTAINDPVSADRDYDALSATLSWDLGENFQLRSISAYSEFEDVHKKDDDAISLSIFYNTPRRLDAKTFTQEFNLLWSNEADTIEGVFGLFYMDDEKEDYSLYGDIATGYRTLPPGSKLYFYSPDYSTESFSAFLDFTWSVTERLRVIAGVRYVDDEVELEQEASISIGPSFEIPTCPLQTNDENFDATIPRFGVQYDLAATSMFYATYTEGFKSGGFNVFACNSRYKPEEIEAFEVGLKNEFFNGSLILNLAAFDYDYTNLQLSQIVGTNTSIANASGAEIRGFEVEGLWFVNEHLSFSGAVSWLDATYTDYQNTDNLDPALGLQDVTGNDLNNAPDLSINFGIAYRTGPVLAGGIITARLDASYRSDIYFREFNNSLDEQEAYSVFQASLMWVSESEKYEVRVFGDNLTDEEFITYMASADPQGTRIVNWGTPRQYGLEMTARF